MSAAYAFFLSMRGISSPRNIVGLQFPSRPGTLSPSKQREEVNGEWGEGRG